MLRCRRRAVVARDILENGAKLLIDIIPLRQCLTLLKRNPGAFAQLDVRLEIFDVYERTLIFAISTLHLLMHLLLNLAL
jgi:hypothetical protein